MFDTVIDVVVWTIITLMVVGAGSAIYGVIEESSHCGRWQNKIVHQEAYVSFIWTGKVMVPIQHTASDYERSVCVEPKSN
jgi:hypothetical protein